MENSSKLFSNALLSNKPNVINIGLKSFSTAIKSHGGIATDLDWQPPAQGDSDAGLALSLLINNPKIAEANKIAYERYLTANPVLIGVDIAKNVLPDMNGKIILHSGPPITWQEMCGPQQGAVLGAILFEGWADNLTDATNLVVNGEIRLEPCHHHDAVGPMAGIISPSMPVWIIKNTTHGNQAYCNMNEGLGKVLRFGANNPNVIERLVWMRDVLGPTLKNIIGQMGEIELKPLMAQALHMGDEVHNRNIAASSLLFRKLTVAALNIPSLDPKDIRETLTFIASNDHFFLNLSMAACKAMLDAASNVPYSSMVTTMARNGVKFGVRISGLPTQWFMADAAYIDGLFFPGYTQDDAARDLGDSAITETAGVGGFSMASAPAIVQFVGGKPSDAIANTMRMLHITLGQNSGFSLPALDFNGCPAGIDIRKVVDNSIQPVINTGIAHKNAGVGQIGAGITYAPIECFTQAVKALAVELNTQEGDH